MKQFDQLPDVKADSFLARRDWEKILNLEDPHLRKFLINCESEATLESFAESFNELFLPSGSVEHIPLSVIRRRLETLFRERDIYLTISDSKVQSYGA